MNFKGFVHFGNQRSHEQLADCEWTFAMFRRVNGPDDAEYILSFRHRDGNAFGCKEIKGMAWGRDVQRLITNIVAKKDFRQSLLSDDPELAALWQRTWKRIKP